MPTHPKTFPPPLVPQTSDHPSHLFPSGRLVRHPRPPPQLVPAVRDICSVALLVRQAPDGLCATRCGPVDDVEVRRDGDGGGGCGWGREAEADVQRSKWGDACEAADTVRLDSGPCVGVVVDQIRVGDRDLSGGQRSSIPSSANTRMKLGVTYPRPDAVVPHAIRHVVRPVVRQDREFLGVNTVRLVPLEVHRLGPVLALVANCTAVCSGQLGSPQ